eukprot:351236-Chlamydomonas_euryale.AAC.2
MHKTSYSQQWHKNAGTCKGANQRPCHTVSSCLRCPAPVAARRQLHAARRQLLSARCRAPARRLPRRSTSRALRRETCTTRAYR